MDLKILGKLTKWMETTDLEEITWKAGTEKISLKVNNSPEPHSNFSSSLIPVFAPAIGIFRFARQGMSNKLKEGMAVKKGAELGVLEVAKELKPVLSPADGNLKIISIEDGKPVEYGQPLFFIEPR